MMVWYSDVWCRIGSNCLFGLLVVVDERFATLATCLYDGFPFERESGGNDRLANNDGIVVDCRYGW